jgi:hypothetical protein
METSRGQHRRITGRLGLCLAAVGADQAPAGGGGRLDCLDRRLGAGVVADVRGALQGVDGEPVVVGWPARRACSTRNAASAGSRATGRCRRSSLRSPVTSKLLHRHAMLYESYERTNGRPTAQWSRLEAGRSDNLGPKS